MIGHAENMRFTEAGLAGIREAEQTAFREGLEDKGKHVRTFS